MARAKTSVPDLEAARIADQERIAKLPNKNINGVLVELTAEQIAENAAIEKADAEREAARPKLPTLTERLESLETDVAALKAVRATK